MIEKLTGSRIKERGLAVTSPPPAESRQQPAAGACEPSLFRRRRARAWRGEITPIRSLGHRHSGGRKRPAGCPVKATAAIVGSGNVATDLLYKLLRSESIQPRWMVGRNPASAGLARARELGLITSPEGLDWLLAQDELPALVFDATCAQAHTSAAPRYRAAGIRVVDLTPAAVGPLVVPAVNLDAQLDAANVNMVTCAGQATVPIVHAIARVNAVRHAQVVVSIAFGSAGPGTRANIDQLIATTGRALQALGGAQRAEASVILDGADPPRPMRASVTCELARGARRHAILRSMHAIVADVAAYVPGYRLVAEPRFDRGRVIVLLEVEGAGDFLARHCGNLDIITAAAARVGQLLAR